MLQLKNKSTEKKKLTHHPNKKSEYSNRIYTAIETRLRGYVLRRVLVKLLTKSTFIDRRVRINQVKLVLSVIYFRATCFVRFSFSLFLPLSCRHPVQSRFVFSNIIVVDCYLAPRFTFPIVTPFMPITLNFVNLVIRFLFCRANFFRSSFCFFFFFLHVHAHVKLQFIS